ncbi:MAG: winged helix-turn-helix domain-containing protein [Acidobacteria bacterium]|nr:winged helix-turn-helix domain-containing protein [Acidobacteriota bacterium]
MAQFRFGLYEFNPATRELRREGNLVRLQSQPAQVLALLLEHAGQVVSRDDLRQAIWGTETFVDFERGLNFCIAQVRSTLNDDAAEPRYIRTVPKRGYQFIAPVTQAGAAASLAPVAKPKRSWGTWTTAAAVVLLALTATGIWLRSRSEPPQVVAVLRFDNETSNPEMTRFGDALTDLLVTELTTNGDGHYKVIGNAHILRLPREQRDLSAIASSLGATYVVLGQVQNVGEQTRVLAHLIHLPDQTHVWVARIDRQVSDPMQLESEIAENVAKQFAPRIRKEFTAMPSHSRASL